MQAQYLAYLVPDPVQGREGAHRLLKNHCDPVAPDRPDPPFRERQKIGLFRPEPDFSATQLRRTGQNAQDRPAGYCLARSAFTDQSQRFTLLHGKRDILTMMHLNMMN